MIKIPKPGSPVRGSESGKPVMALFDLLGRRWSMGIIWNLSQSPMNFRQLQEKCESISPTILNTRLKELRMALLIENSDDGYALTTLGEELFHLLHPFKSYAIKWGELLKEKENNHGKELCKE